MLGITVLEYNINIQVVVKHVATYICKYMRICYGYDESLSTNIHLFELGKEIQVICCIGKRFVMFIEYMARRMRLYFTTRHNTTLGILNGFMQLSLFP